MSVEIIDVARVELSFTQRELKRAFRASTVRRRLRDVVRVR